MHTNRSSLFLSCGALTACVVAASALAAADAQQQAPATQRGTPAQVNNVPAIPPTPTAVRELVYARPFTLTASYQHEYRKDRPLVDAGYIVVLRANNDLLFPRQVAMPILMVGNQTAEPMNVGYASGTLVAIVPASKKADGSVDLDLGAKPIFFGQPMLPESVDQATADGQLRFAADSGIRPLSAAAVQAALAKGGATVALADREALDRLLGGLVRTYAADEVERADELEGKIDTTTKIVKP